MPPAPQRGGFALRGLCGLGSIWAVGSLGGSDTASPTQEKSWRNSVRHNLSLNECFVKAGRSDNGKGHFWAIHPANLEDFSKGDYHRRRARRRIRR